jgi:predicted dehydrogenase
VDTVREELEEFARAVRGECGYEVPGEAALGSVAVLEAAVRSAAERREVYLAEVLG